MSGLDGWTYVSVQMGSGWAGALLPVELIRATRLPLSTVGEADDKIRSRRGRRGDLTPGSKRVEARGTLIRAFPPARVGLGGRLQDPPSIIP